MLVGDRDAADDRTHDAHEALIRTADKQVLDGSCAVEPFIRRAIHGPVVVPSEAANRLGCEKIGIDDMSSEIWPQRRI